MFDPFLTLCKRSLQLSVGAACVQSITWTQWRRPRNFWDAYVRSRVWHIFRASRSFSMLQTISKDSCCFCKYHAYTFIFRTRTHIHTNAYLHTPLHSQTHFHTLILYVHTAMENYFWFAEVFFAIFTYLKTSLALSVCVLSVCLSVCLSVSLSLSLSLSLCLSLSHTHTHTHTRYIYESW